MTSIDYNENCSPSEEMKLLFRVWEKNKDTCKYFNVIFLPLEIKTNCLDKLNFPQKKKK